MNAQELLEEWTSGESSGVRPARVQQLRDDLREYVTVPIPRRLSEIESWQQRMKGQVTKDLRKAAEAEE